MAELLSSAALDTTADGAGGCDSGAEAGDDVVGIPAENAIIGISTAHRLIHHRFRKWYLLFKSPAASGLNSAAGIKKKIDAQVVARPARAHIRKKVDRIHRDTFFPFKVITSFI
jgi:hypothetical protein